MTFITIRDDAHWHELRAKNIGASEVAALFDCSPYISKYTLWQVKAGRMEPPFVDGPRPKWGRRLEEVIADAVHEDLGIGPARRCGYVQHPRVRGMGCTPDFVLGFDPAVFGYSQGDGGILETKNVDWLVKKREWGDEPPMHILLQLQAQLACTGLNWGIVAALVGGNELAHWRYEARPKLIAEIERRVADFWESIGRDDPPQIDGSKSTYAAVKAMLPREWGDNSSIEIDTEEFAELCARIDYAKLQIKGLDDGRRACEAELMTMLNGAQRGYGMGWSASLITVKDTPPRVITEADVGKTLPGRKGSVRLQVKGYSE